MFSKTLIATALLASIVAPLAASAGEVEHRIDNQQHRINQGVKNGSLTNGEYTRLDNREDRIQAERNRDLRRNDGHLTPTEYKRLNRQENRLSDQIYFQKHDRQHQHR
jgi:hypothetical protein